MTLKLVLLYKELLEERASRTGCARRRARLPRQPRRRPRAAASRLRAGESVPRRTTRRRAATEPRRRRHPPHVADVAGVGVAATTSRRRPGRAAPRRTRAGPSPPAPVATPRAARDRRAERDAAGDHPPALHAVRRRRAFRRARAGGARRRGVEITLVTRRWPRDGDPAHHAADRRPALRRPHAARRAASRARPARRSRACRARSCSRTSASRAATSTAPATACTRSGSRSGARRVGRRRAWRSRASPYHRYMLAAERRLYASPRLKQVICISRMVQARDPRALRAAARAPAGHLQRDRSARCSIPGSRAHRDERPRALRHRARTRACSCWSAPAYARKGVARAIEALASRAGRPRTCRRRPRPASGALRGARAPPRRRGPRDVRRRADGSEAVLRRGRRVRAADALRRAVQRRARGAGLRAAGRHERPLRRGRARRARTTRASSAARATSARSPPACAALPTPDARARAGANALAAVRPLTPDAMAARLVRALRERCCRPR